MTTSGRSWDYPLGLASWLAICGASAYFGDCAKAQNITLDGSLGPAQTLTGPKYVIPQAVGQTVGSNLFHSFGEFSLDTGESAVFQSAANIRNILSRVTGGSSSLINGRIYATQSSSVNLFLINPSGIVFGRNAEINVGGATRGSFVATTVDSLVWPNGKQFSATNPGGANSLLTIVGDPSGFISSLRPPKPITSSGSTLGVYEGQSLLLLGGDVTLDGSYLLVDLPAGGQISLGGVAGPGTVGLKVDGNNLRLSFPDDVARADVSIINNTVLDVAAEDGGSIAINARNLNISGGSTLFAGIGQELGAVGSQAGDIQINTTGAVTVAGSYIFNIVGSKAVGNSGNINITTESLSLTAGTQLQSLTRGQGNAGSVTINADTVSFDGVGSNGFTNGALSTVESGAVGNGGNINITARALSITDGAQVQTLVRGASFDGTLPGGQGNAGNVNIVVTDTVSFDGVSSTVSFDGVSSNESSSAALSNVESGAFGKGGDINITAGSLSVRDGARLNASTFGQGNAGSVTVNVREWVSFDGVGSNGLPSSALSNVEPETIGNAGGINITAGSLLVTNGARVESLTRGQGNAGSVNINADTVSFDGGKSYGQELGAYQEPNRDDPERGIVQSLYDDGSYRWFSGAYTSVEATSSKGEGGNIIITTGSLSLTDGAQLSARSIGNDTAGNIEVKEASSIRLDNNALLIANTRVGQGGNILLDSEDLVLRRGSNITTNATGTATGGNITIDTDIIAALEDSDISANAEEAFGGRVIINAQGIFGTKFRERENPVTSDITATSELGPEFSGTVEINTPDIDPSSGLVNLPVVPVDTEVAQGCTAGSSLARSEFIITGRGGLPPNPGDALSTDAVQVDLITLEREHEIIRASGVEEAGEEITSEIVEATGWVKDANGNVVLIADASTLTSHSSWHKTTDCRGFNQQPGR